VSFEREADVAREAALAAGRVIARHAAAGAQARPKVADNPVTAADLEANAAIGAVIRKAFPRRCSRRDADDSARLGASRVWIVDPLDGTKEFVEGVPQFAVSVALVVEAGRRGVRYQPTRECFHARRGAGAWLGGERLAVSQRRARQSAPVARAPS
jgi:myo-inositol-1(or 4)-monophosphatase